MTNHSMSKVYEQSEIENEAKLEFAEKERDAFPCQEVLNRWYSHTSNKERYISAEELSNDEQDELLQ